MAEAFHAFPSLSTTSQRPTASRCIQIVGLMVFTMMFCQFGRAQAAGGSVSGTVVDATGNAVPRATVQVKNVATGVVLTTLTNTPAITSFPLFYPEVTSKPSMQTASVTARPALSKCRQASGRTSQCRLQVGSVAETVTVSAAAQLMNLTTSDLGTEVTPEKVNNLPLNERNFFPLIGLQPGVNASSSASAQNGRGGFEVNGAAGLSNNILLDGVDATFGETNGIGAGAGSITNTLSVDAIAEFRTLSRSVPSAEYGAPQEAF